MFNNCLQKFLSKKLDYREKIATVPKLTIYFELPFTGRSSSDVIRQLTRILAVYYPHMNPRFYFKSPRKIRSIFSLKDRTPDGMRYNVVYQYTCSCDQRYIGSTAVNLYVRIAQHMGVSPRTGIPSRSPVSSAIRDHYMKCKSDFDAENFKILDSASDATQLRILESMYIVENNPEMNDTTSAAPFILTKTIVSIILID